MGKYFSPILLALFAFLLCQRQVMAASISLTPPSTTNFSHTDEISIRVKLAISSSSTYYLRGVFFKPGSSNYCGSTWNGSDYFSGPYTQSENWKKFLQVTPTDGVWEGELKAKIDTTDSGCDSSGEYSFKIQRFTESGSVNFDSQEELKLSFVIPTPTSAPTSTPTPSPTSKPTPTEKPAPTSKPTPTQKLTPTSPPVPQALNSPSKTMPVVSSQGAGNNTAFTHYQSTTEAVLSESTKSAAVSKNPTPKITTPENEATKANIATYFFSFGGVIMLILCGILGFTRYRK